MLKLIELTETLQQESTRDLAWALFSPELLNDPTVTHFHVEPTAERLDWLIKLDTEITTLADSIVPSQRLGRYYESLWTYFFRHDTQYKLAAHNLAVRNPQKTLGELDFIIYDNLAGQFIHLEIAVKFYLFHAPANTGAITDNRHWPGPNSDDTLENKWRKLCNEQLALSQREECKNLLRLSGINEPLKAAVSLKGYLFRQPGSSQTPLHFNPANRIHPYYNAGSFIGNHSGKKLLGVIPKSRWLTRTHDKQHIALFKAEDIVQQVEKRATPVMAGTFEKYGNFFRETERFFIVPGQWP